MYRSAELKGSKNVKEIIHVGINKLKLLYKSTVIAKRLAWINTLKITQGLKRDNILYALPVGVGANEHFVVRLLTKLSGCCSKSKCFPSSKWSINEEWRHKFLATGIPSDKVNC